MTIQIAALGWEHSGWWNGFYPDDLPEEWRLTYFANEFHAVVVPAYRWCAVDDATLRQWVGDVDSRFQFFWEIPPDIEVTAVERLLGLLADDASPPGGFVLHETPTDATHYMELTAQLRPCAPAVRLPAWPGDDVEPCQLAGLSDGLAGMVVHNLRDAAPLRQCLERFIPLAASEGHGLIVLTGDPPPIEGLRTLQTLVDLFGV